MTYSPKLALLVSTLWLVFVSQPFQAVEIPIDMGAQLQPENIGVYVGDTVIWRAGQSADTESYGGEWKSPVLQPGETFSYKFETPGTFVYRSGEYSGGDLLGRVAGSIRPLCRLRWAAGNGNGEVEF